MTGIVLCHGHFRIVHIGHIWHLRAARALGDRLVVSITSDAFVNREMPPGITEQDRAESLRALRCVDEVYICREATGASAIRHFKPAFYVKGIDYEASGIGWPEVEACNEVGATIQFTRTMKHASGKLMGFI